MYDENYIHARLHPVYGGYHTTILATVMFLSVASLINRVAEFVTVYQGNVTTSLNSVTDSVGWQDPKIITDNIYSGEPTVMGLAYSQQTLATVWVDGSIEIQFASLPPDRISQIEWSNPINISTRQGHESRHPHAVLGLTVGAMKLSEEENLKAVANRWLYESGILNADNSTCKQGLRLFDVDQ
jgi:hypothetical protein